MASSVSQRQIVVSPMEATSPRRRTSCLISGIEWRDKGKLWLRGSSQAKALTATTTLGGKAGWPPAARLFEQPCKALLEEAFAPLADDLPWSVEPGSDLIVAGALCGVEDDLGPDHVPIRRRVPASHALKLLLLLGSQLNGKRASSRHRIFCRPAGAADISIRHRIYGGKYLVHGEGRLWVIPAGLPASSS